MVIPGAGAAAVATGSGAKAQPLGPAPLEELDMQVLSISFFSLQAIVIYCQAALSGFVDDSQLLIQNLSSWGMQQNLPSSTIPLESLATV